MTRFQASRQRLGRLMRLSWWIVAAFSETIDTGELMTMLHNMELEYSEANVKELLKEVSCGCGTPHAKGGLC